MKHLRKFIGHVVAAGAIVALGAACSSSTTPAAAAPTTRNLDQIVSSGTINVCSTGDYRPFTYRDPSGQWSGADIEMAQDLAHRLGVKLNLVQTTWGTLMTDLNTKCDMAMGGITTTLDRAEHALYSSPYLRDGKAAIARCADQAKYTSLADIDKPGVRVIVIPNGSNAQFDKANLHQATVVQYPDNNTIFDQILMNKADVMITDTSEVRYQTTQHPGQLCPISTDKPFNFGQKAYLIPQGDPMLQQWVDQWLNIAQNDGTYARISTKWMGQVTGP